MQTAFVGCLLRVSDVDLVVQIPGVSRSKASHAECFNQSIEILGWPKRGIRRHSRGSMRRPKPTSVACYQCCATIKLRKSVNQDEKLSALAA